MNKLRRRSTSTEFEIERGIEFRHQLRNAANIKLPFAWYPNDGIRHSVAAIQQPLLFHFFVPSIRTFHQKKDRDADIIKTRAKHFVHDATYFISSYGHRNSPCISFQPPTVLRTNTMTNKRIIITRSYCNCAATADKSMQHAVTIPPSPTKKYVQQERKNVGTHTPTRGRKIPSRSRMLWSIHADSMQIYTLPKESHILSRRYMGKSNTNNTDDVWNSNA